MTLTQVETAYGTLQGAQSGDIFTWKGIPFARAPIGPLRFQPPQPPLAWTGVRDALKFGTASAQPPMQNAALMSGSRDTGSEDCLYLNIWSPGTDHANRPVMVWIHGGAFVTGSGSIPWYDGTAFATHGDVVVVTLNYRLGALGFLSLADMEKPHYASANYGLLDQIAALRWVQEHIAAFGGDPRNVTIFGESAGAMSIGALLAMPEAQGLFKRAILQSGSCYNVQTREQAHKRSLEFLDALGLAPERLSLLNEVPLDEIMKAQNQLMQRFGGLPFAPVIDGVTLPHKPIEAIKSGSAADVTLLIGTNYDEMRLFTAFDQQQATPNQEQLQHTFGERAALVMATYEGARAGNTSAAWVDLLTDRTFRIPAIRLAERQSQQGTAVWMYRFDWPTPNFGGLLGACHALEIPFVWDNLNQPGVTMLTGDSPTRQPIADRMHAAWIAFARTGDPNIASLPAWTAYDIQQRATMLFNETCEIAYDPQHDTRQLWEGIIA